MLLYKTIFSNEMSSDLEFSKRRGQFLSLLILNRNSIVSCYLDNSKGQGFGSALIYEALM